MQQSNNIRERIFEVDQNFDGWRLDLFLVARLPRLSRTRAAEIVKFGDLTLQRANNPPKKIKASTKLIYQDKILLREHLPPENLIDEEVSICFEDEEIIALSKPPGMLVHEAGKVRLNTIVAYLERHGYADAGPVHRIDRETSGIVLCGKNKAWISKLGKIFEHHHPQKTYRAIVRDENERWPIGDLQSIDIPLGLKKESLSGIMMGKGSLHAKTHVKVLASRLIKDVKCKDLEVEIETGRQHQIRVHLAMAHTPIAGDKLYGRNERYYLDTIDARNAAPLKEPNIDPTLLFQRHALHAWKLFFTHPEKGEIRIISKLPYDIWP